MTQFRAGVARHAMMVVSERSPVRAWRGDRAAECGGLENRCTPRVPGVRIPPSPLDVRPVPRRAAPLRAPPDAVSAVIGAADPEEAAGVTETGRRLTAAAAVLRGVWWMTEAVPLPATALVPLVLFPSHRLPQGRPRRHHRLRSVDAHGGCLWPSPWPYSSCRLRATPGVRLLDWEVAADLPWDVLLLFGGVAVGVGVDPLLLVVPVALAATCAARTIRWTARAARLLLPLPGRSGPRAGPARCPGRAHWGSLVRSPQRAWRCRIVA